MKTFLKWVAIGFILSCVSHSAHSQIRPPDISTSTNSVWTWRGKTKYGGGTPSVTQTEGSVYVTNLLEAASKLYFLGTPNASSTESLIQIGATPVGGNTNGTYLHYNLDTAFAGDIIRAQKNGGSTIYSLDYQGYQYLAGRLGIGITPSFPIDAQITSNSFSTLGQFKNASTGTSAAAQFGVNADIGQVSFGILGSNNSTQIDYGPANYGFFRSSTAVPGFNWIVRNGTLNIYAGTDATGTPKFTATTTAIKFPTVPSASCLQTSADGTVSAGSCGGGGGGTTVKVVKASDSTWSGTADYTADGTADQTEINNAITALASTGGGDVVLTDGNFSINGPITANAAVRLLGFSSALTHVNRAFNGTTDANGAMVYITSNVFRGSKNIYFDGMSGTYTTATYNRGFYSNTGLSNVTIEDCSFVNHKGNELDFPSIADSIIKHNVFSGGGANIISVTSGFNRNKFEQNQLSGGTVSVNVGGGQDSLIAENVVTGSGSGHALSLTGVSRMRVEHNYVTNSGSNYCIYINGSSNADNNVTGNETSGGTYGMLITNSPRCFIANNSIASATINGLYIDSSDYSVISNNIIRTITQSGIYSTSINYVTITGNKIVDPASNATSDGMQLSGSFNYGMIANNTIYRSGGVATGYAINIASGATGNTLTGNYYRGNGTSSINDAGTGTLWSSQYDGQQTITKGQSLNVVSKTANYTLTAQDDIVSVDPTGGTVTITVPTASVAYKGKIYVIKNASSSTNAINITPTSGTIDGANPSITTAWGVVRIFCNSSQWVTM